MFDFWEPTFINCDQGIGIAKIVHRNQLGGCLHRVREGWEPWYICGYLEGCFPRRLRVLKASRKSYLRRESEWATSVGILIVPNIILTKDLFNRTIERHKRHNQSPGESKHPRKCSALVVPRRSSKIIVAKIKRICSSSGDILEMGAKSMLLYTWLGANMANSS